VRSPEPVALQNGPPRGIDEDVVLAEYDPRWPGLYAEEASRILALVGDRVLEIEHFGSTAIPGLAAKPVIDIVAAVPSLDELDALTEPLRLLGYLPWLYPDRRLHVKWVNGVRTFHVHVVALGSAFWEERRLFRDYLRAHPAEAREYERLKRVLVERHRTDREAYTEAKTKFIRRVNARAQRWQTRTASASD
jgi:GrpB-like predicted nucleotidyltransferase (UPF0157 family)